MNIAIDARMLERNITGIGRFLWTFINELPEVDKKNKYFLFSYEPLKIKEDFYTNISTVKSILPQKIFSPIWNNFILPRYLRKHNIDILFSVNQVIPVVKPRGIKYICMLHDVIYLVNKSFHPLIYRKYLKLLVHFSVKSSDLIITVSNYSKQDILKYYKIDEQKVKVVHLAAEKRFKPVDLKEDEICEIKKMLGNPKHIVLYLGMIENRKNISGILKIADAIASKTKDIKFLLIGKIGYGGEKLKDEIAKRKNVAYLRAVDDELLRKLYNVSSVFLFPSYYEGFGFPPLEAMQSGLPTLSSSNTSLKEIIGEGGIMYDADDVKSFTNEIFKIVNDEAYALKMREKGIEQAQKFNITKTVSDIVTIFNTL